MAKIAASFAPDMQHKKREHLSLLMMAEDVCYIIYYGANQLKS